MVRVAMRSGGTIGDMIAQVRRHPPIAAHALLLAALIALPRPAPGDEAAIVRNLAQFLTSSDAAERARLAEQVSADPAFDRSRLSKWLHAAALFEPLPAGRHAISAALPSGASRQVVLRVPKDYDAKRAWPLIYCLHGDGGSAESILVFVERLLGERVEQYVLAAPDQYEEVAIHQQVWPPAGEHAAILAALRKAIHVDNERVHALGYSKGGHTAWTLAVMLPDAFASVMPLAGTFLLETTDKLWDTFLPSALHTPVFCVWGANDTADSSGGESKAGGIAGVNRRLRSATKKNRIPASMTELPDVGHADVSPPPQVLDDFLIMRRVETPTNFSFAFRHISQGRAWWVEANEWTGPEWDGKPLNLTLPPGRALTDQEAVNEAMASALRRRLGELGGEIKGNAITVRRKNVAVLTVWLGNDTIDWNKPVTLKVGGEKAFEGRLEPDLLLCLTQAAETHDFERLRWAALRYRRGEGAKILRGDGTETRPAAPATAPKARPKERK